jgi:hypothetical protein
MHSFFLLFFTRLEDSRLSAMLRGVLIVCLHEVAKDASNPRLLCTNIEFLIVSLDLRILGSRACFVVGS